MTLPSVDIVTSLKEDIEARIAAVPELVGKDKYIYDADQLSEQMTKLSLPGILFHYAGMLEGSQGLKHSVYFHVYLAARSKSSSQIAGHTAIPTATELLQRFRKEMACNTTTSQREWKLAQELPVFGLDDKLVYRQRWYTVWHIKS